jgi:hypothetical protein
LGKSSFFDLEKWQNTEGYDIWIFYKLEEKQHRIVSYHKFYALFLASLERRAEKIFRGERVFEERNRSFLSSKTHSPR